jgi:hypothetical protein
LSCTVRQPDVTFEVSPTGGFGEGVVFVPPLVSGGALGLVGCPGWDCCATAHINNEMTTTAVGHRRMLP